MTHRNRFSREIVDLQNLLDARASHETADWWTKYLRGTANFRGVPMSSVRSTVHAWYRDRRLNALSVDDRFNLACDLIRLSYTEDKLAGILLIHEILLPSRDIAWRNALDTWAMLFEDGYLSDWNVCDWFCVKVLGSVIEIEGESAARVVSSWTRTPLLWRARAGLVAFANHARHCDGLFPGAGRMVLGSAESLVVRPERFAKTAVGWVVRELGICMPAEVRAFCRKHLADFSLEAMKNVTRRLPSDVRADLLAAFRNLPSDGSSDAPA